MNNNDKTPRKPQFTKIYMLGAPVRFGTRNIYAMKKKPVLGFNYFFTCPVCAHTVHLNLSVPGQQRIVCKNCQTPTIVEGRTREEALKAAAGRTANKKEMPAPPVDKMERDEKNNKSGLQNEGQNKNSDKITSEQSPVDGGMKQPTPPWWDVKIYNAKICWGGLLTRKQYSLQIGENWIGRKDKEQPSDVNVKDRFMSRRSVCIEVTRVGENYIFKMTVHNATNPVTYMGMELKVGQSVFLNYDDIFLLGDTVFQLKKIQP